METLLKKTIKYVVYKEGKHYVSQCLNVDVSSFGSSAKEAVDNLTEALELYFEDGDALKSYQPIKETLVGESHICV